MLTLFGPLNLVSKMTGWFLIVVCIGLFITLKVEQRALAKANAHIIKLVAAREADRLRYELAQIAAADLNHQEVQRIETQQQRITANVEADLTSRLERLRSELRKQGAANQGASRGTGASGVSKGTGPAPSQTTVQISTEDYVYGAELEEKLDQWITWYEQQRQIQR